MTSVNFAALAAIADPVHLKLIVVLAAHFAKRERQAWPKLTTLAERAGMPRSTGAAGTPRNGTARLPRAPEALRDVDPLHNREPLFRRRRQVRKSDN